MKPIRYSTANGAGEPLPRPPGLNTPTPQAHNQPKIHIPQTAQKIQNKWNPVTQKESGDIESAYQKMLAEHKKERAFIRERGYSPDKALTRHQQQIEEFNGKHGRDSGKYSTPIRPVSKEIAEPREASQSQITQLTNWQYDPRTHLITTPKGNQITRDALLAEIKAKHKRENDRTRGKGLEENTRNRHMREWELYRRLTGHDVE